jgi:cytochrome P450
MLLFSGVPHKVTEDDEYNGFFIPKNTSIILNQWSMLHDPNVYPDPDRFIPERFLPGSFSAERILGEPPIDPREIAFGFGRR